MPDKLRQASLADLAKVDPVWLVRHRLQRQPVPGPKVIAPASGPDAEVQQPLNARGRPDLPHDVLQVAAMNPAAGVLHVGRDRPGHQIVLKLL